MLCKVAVISGLLAIVLSASVPNHTEIPIVSQESDVQPDGSYKWSYESADGTKQEQTATLKQTANGTVEAIQGSVTWVDPQGGQHHLSYTADESGFQAQGDDIPVPPEVPVAIARALQNITSSPQTTTITY
ncbi:endocuticle structural glycoprotein ABD-4-like [Sitophilus oryzae]|uniref:Endocuticle structural glycoprotein ABD-4-like n=1 Tax=Sitophilus oryzae TaxID=7048 RepID=A0A6J2Y2B4_SITOR|nr:endocuticle structural glycoprotein ABD-4-like [Sitophilus oryzae]